MNAAILLSGGTGTRFGAEIPKQYIRVAGKMIITYSLEVLTAHSKIDEVVIVAEGEWQEQILADIRKQGQNADKIIGFAIPGVTRQFSILNGLNKLREMGFSVENVLIHDAARPNLTLDMVSACLAALKEHDGVMPVLPMKDTVYLSEDGRCVSQLLERSRLFAGQAPEGFRFDLYYEANQKLLPDRLHFVNGSTEPAVLAGMDVAMIPGDEQNYKITTRADLVRFAAAME